MSELSTIFEKIKKVFLTNLSQDEEKEDYHLIFSPFSTGFTYDDFLFLDSNMATEDAKKYVDELYEFSQIANTIPRENNFWALSGQQKDYLFNPYKSILQSLRLLDPDTIKIEMFYKHPIFLKALEVLGTEDINGYKSFFELRTKIANEIENLGDSLNDANKAAIELEIQLKKDNLKSVEKQWKETGNKEEIDEKILTIVKDEFKRFLLRFNEVKGILDTAKREHAGSGDSFYLTSCLPNNLYDGEKIEWTKIEMNKSDLEEIKKDIQPEEYSEIIGSSGLSDLEFEKITFEVLFAGVTRPWFDNRILNSPFWTIHILNKEEIEIPRVTSKLIFVRQVEMKVSDNEKNKKVLLQHKTLQNLGPFIVNMAQLKTGQKVQLNSVNKGLKLNRKTLLNVSAQLHRKKELNKNQSIQKVIAKKQSQFLRLSPQLRQMQSIKMTTVKKPPVIKKSLLAKPMLFLKLNTMLLNQVSCRFNFKDANTQKDVAVAIEEIKILKQGKPISIKMTKSNNGLATNLPANTMYEIRIQTKGYEQLQFSFKTTTKKSNKNLSNYTFKLNPEVVEEVDIESFQLIGVVARVIKPFPQPIQTADYI
ncbi:hypothetical protein [Galbibacter sp.]|uniref:hypothetical protein n=1 Tax=Galbibacter sp. TaxID=2918471 RepID=UPI003A9589F7